MGAKLSSTYGSAYAGGLIGLNNNNITISNCYATGNVSATINNSNAPYVGGLVGYISSSVSVASISNCYATGNVSGITNGVIACVGGLVGYMNNITITNCYRYEGQVFYREQSNGTFNTANELGVELCSLLDLNDVDFYIITLGWDSDIWNITDLDFESGKYPRL